MMRATATAISSKDTRSACVASHVSTGRIFCLTLSAKESCSMRKLILVFLCVILAAACNRDRAENTDTAGTGTATAPAVDETTTTMSGTSDTAPIQAVGTTEVTPTDTSSTIVTPTTTTAGITSPTETSSTVVTT